MLSDPGTQLSPVAVLDTKYIGRAGSSAQQIKVKWSGLSQALTTWGDEQDLRRQYPKAEAWGKASSKGGG